MFITEWTGVAHRRARYHCITAVKPMARLGVFHLHRPVPGWTKYYLSDVIDRH